MALRCYNKQISFGWRYLLVFIILFASSCSRELDINPPFEGEKLVVNARISSVGINVQVSFSANPVGTFLIEKTRYVDDAVVSLFENNTLVAVLEHEAEGNYILPNGINITPTPGFSYRIEVASAQYGEAKSSNVTFPQITNVIYSKLLEIGPEPGTGSQKSRGLLRFVIDVGAKDNRFVELIINSAQEDCLYYSKPDDEITESFSNPCEVESRYGKVISTRCGTTNLDTLQFIFDIQYQALSSGIEELLNYDDLELVVNSVSQEYFDYIGSMNYFLDTDADMGLIFGVPEPKTLKSNIMGGYGVFYASNSKTIDLVVQ
ncbi:MAG: DUF4249 family protein [Bacteroidales bacterium]